MTAVSADRTGIDLMPLESRRELAQAGYRPADLTDWIVSRIAAGFRECAHGKE
jgi:hypothetical protein